MFAPFAYRILYQKLEKNEKYHPTPMKLKADLQTDYNRKIPRLIFFNINEPRCEKTGLRGFKSGPTQTGLYSHRRWLEACNFGFRKKKDCTIYAAKTKALISFCVFVFAYAKSRFSHGAAQILQVFEVIEC